MYQTKLVQVLKKLDNLELIALDKFIKSPYFNTNPSISKLWKYLKRYAPEFNKTKLQEEKIFKRIFPKKTYNERTLRQLRSQLFKVVEEFLAIQQFQNNSFYKPFLLAKSYEILPYKKALFSLHRRQLNQAILHQNMWTYLHKLRWLEFQYFSDHTTKLSQSPTPLKNTLVALDLFYIGGKLKYACELASWNQIMGVSYKIPLLEEVLDFCENEKEKLPSFQLLYWTALILIETPNHANFFNLKSIFLSRRDDVTIEEQSILLTYLLNFTFKQIQKSDKSFVVEAYNLYEYGIDNKLFLANKQFLEDHFINIVTICSNLKKFSWLDKFLNSIGDDLPSIIEASAYNTSMARLAFEKKKFQICLDYLNKVNHNNVIHSMKARYASIACYYELKKPVVFIKANCKSFKEFTKRKLTHKKELHVGCLNFVRIVTELLSSKPNKEKILKIVKSENHIVFRDWVLAKIKEKFE